MLQKEEMMVKAYFEQAMDVLSRTITLTDGYIKNKVPVQDKERSFLWNVL